MKTRGGCGESVLQSKNKRCTTHLSFSITTTYKDASIVETKSSNQVTSPSSTQLDRTPGCVYACVSSTHTDTHTRIHIAMATLTVLASLSGINVAARP